MPDYLVKSITWQTLQAVNFCHKHNVSPLTSTNHCWNMALEERGGSVGIFLIPELSWDGVRGIFLF